jgi:hypothetical protein
LAIPGQGGGTNSAQRLRGSRVPPPAWADALASGIKADLRAYLLEVLGMATIVTTMLYVPAATLLAGLFVVAGVPIASLVSFGHALHPVAGLAAWWAIFFIPAAVYCGFTVPWDGREPRT